MGFDQKALSKATINKKVLPNTVGIAWISISNYCAWKSANPWRDCDILPAFNRVFIKLIYLIIHLLPSLSPILLPAYTELIIHPALCGYVDYSLHVSNVQVLSSCTRCLFPTCISHRPFVDPNADIDMNKLSKSVCMFVFMNMWQSWIIIQVIDVGVTAWLPRGCGNVFVSFLPRCRTSWGGGWW